MKVICGTFVVILCLCKRIQSLAVPSGSCVDKVACDRYSPDICTDQAYFDWTTQNCPSYCGVCSQPTQGTHVGFGRFMDSNGGTAQCKDVVSNCAEYGNKMCSDVKFYNWVNDNCQKFCNRCVIKCEDTIPNCSEYGASVCTDLSYYNWVEMHCRKFCARCTS